MTPALLAKAIASPKPADDATGPRADQADTGHPLLAVTWLDLSGLPLDEGAPTTVEDALADVLLSEWETQYQAHVDDLQQRHADLPTVDPWDDAHREALRAKAKTVAKARLEQYETRLKKFLATSPTEDDLADWLANRATNDAGIWARLDALDVRQQATDDFYAVNPTAKVPPKGQKWTIVPDHAAESRCLAVIGVLYDTYDEAAMALSMAQHPNCPHYVDIA